MSAVPAPKKQPAEVKATPEVASLPPETRRANQKTSDQTKYTDVKRTSSASFKPPMTKEQVKPQIQPPPKDSSWFAPFSYIKTMFGTKSVASAANTSVEKNNKSSSQQNTVKNTSNMKPDNSKYSKYTRDPDDKFGGDCKEGNFPSALMSNTDGNSPRTRPKSPSFSISPKDAVTKREPPMNTSTIFEMDEDLDPNAPKYKSIQNENQSTFLHAPDKKGTTSFRITTLPKVGVKQTPTVLSPSFSSSQQKKPMKMSRKGSTSPNKTRADSSSTRLRSKSTPDSSSMKPRPVSASSTIPKSISLKNTSQKNGTPTTTPSKEVKPVSNAKALPKTSFSYNANVLRDAANLATARSTLVRAPRSPITINHTSSIAFAAHKTSVTGEAPINAIQNTSSSNSTLRGREPTSVLLSESPTFPNPSLPQHGTKISIKKQNNAVEKYQKTRIMVNNKMKGKTQPPPLEPPVSPRLQERKMAPVPAVQIKIPKATGSSPLGAMPDKPSFDFHAPVPESQQSPKKTITLCQATVPVVSQSDRSLSIESRTTAFRAVEVKNKVEDEKSLEPSSSVSNTSSAHVVRSSNSASKHPCIRMVNSSQHHPKHPTRPQVFNVSNRKQSSFTNLLVADNRKDQERTGELAESSYTNARKKISNSQLIAPRGLVVQNLSSGDDDLMITVPSFYNTSNSASCDICPALGNNYHDYKIDSLICDDYIIAQNTCNSAHSGMDPITYNTDGMMPTSIMADNEEDCVYEVPFGPSVVVPRKISDDVPVNRFYDDKSVSECYSSSSFSENTRPSRGARRKYPFDLEIDKVKQHERVGRTPSPSIIKRTPIPSTSSQLPTNLGYMQSGKSTKFEKSPSRSKVSSTLQYLHQNKKVETPTVLEPSETVEKKIWRASPTRSTPATNFNSFASTVGDAIGAISNAFQTSFLGVVSPDPKKIDIRQNSPKRSEPTKIIEKPLSATRSYVSSVLEEKGVSKAVETSLNTLKSFIDLGGTKKETEKTKEKVVDLEKFGKDKSTTLTSSRSAIEKRPVKNTEKSQIVDSQEKVPKESNAQSLDRASSRNAKLAETNIATRIAPKETQIYKNAQIKESPFNKKAISLEKSETNIIPPKSSPVDAPKPTVVTDIGKKLGSEMSKKQKVQTPVVAEKPLDVKPVVIPEVKPKEVKQKDSDIAPKIPANKEIKVVPQTTEKPKKKYRHSLEKFENSKYPNMMSKYDPASFASVQTRLGELP